METNKEVYYNNYIKVKERCRTIYCGLKNTKDNQEIYNKIINGGKENE